SYFEVIVPATKNDWEAFSQRDSRRNLYYGMGERLTFRNRNEYKKAVKADFEHMRRGIRERLTRGILHAGTQCYSENSIRLLRTTMSVQRPFESSPQEVAACLCLLPILHQTTRDVGASAGIMHIRKSDSKIPCVVLTSPFSATILNICQLVLRRTFLCPSQDALELRPGRTDKTLLDRDSRLLMHLIGVWIVSEPPPEEEFDVSSSALAYAPGDLQRAAEGNAILWVKSGWSLFEALHEFS